MLASCEHGRGTLLLVQGASSSLTQCWFILAAVVEVQPLYSYFFLNIKFSASTAVYTSRSNYRFANFFFTATLRSA